MHAGEWLTRDVHTCPRADLLERAAKGSSHKQPTAHAHIAGDGSIRLIRARVTVPSLDTERVRLVILEHGARVDGSLVPRADADHTVVVVQGKTEDSAQLLLRVMRFVLSTERAGARLKEALLVVGGSKNRRSAATREFVARALLAHFERSDSGQLVISVNSELSKDDREAALSLAEKLLADPAIRSSNARVHFAEREPLRSEIRAALPCAAATTGASAGGA